MQEELTIQVFNVSKSFGDRKAVDDVSFQVRKGEVVGFLGPNGAGKTTTMRLLTSYYTPDTGRILIEGIDTQVDDLVTRQLIGYLPENNPLYGDLLVSEYLDIVADLRGLSKTQRRAEIERTVSETGIAEVFYRPINQLSKGYRQRVGLAQAILHRPDILIMDEPTEGLDPNQRVTIRDLIKSLGQDRTVLLSTHVLQEVETTCDRILLINRGRIVAHGTLQELRQAAMKRRSIQLEVAGTRVESALQGLEGVEAVQPEGTVDGRRRFSLAVAEDADPRPDIFRLAKERGWVLWELHEERARLEDVFHFLTVESQADTEAEDQD